MADDFFVERSRPLTGSIRGVRRGPAPRRLAPRKVPDTMHVCHLSTSDQAGGASIAAWRLHRGLVAAGVDSRMLVESRTSEDPRVALPNWPRDFRSRLSRWSRRRRIAADRAAGLGVPEPRCELYSDDRTAFGATLHDQIPNDADLLHLHWVAGLVDYGAFLPAAAQRRPLVWTFHDLNPMRGGTHYAEPDIPESRLGEPVPEGAFPLTRSILERKAKAFAALPHDRLTLIAPCSWMLAEIEACPVLRRFPAHRIPYGIDAERFKPLDRTTARSVLGIQEKAPCLLACADSLEVGRKGMGQLMQALGQIPAPKTGIPRPTLALIGGHGASLAASIPDSVEVVALGRITHPGLMALAYAASDLFVIPSLQDNLPNVVLEAMACARPVVGYATGGIPDMIVDGTTGRLVPRGDVAALGTAIADLLANRATLEAMGGAARERVLAHFTLDHQATSMEAVYRSILENVGIGGHSQATRSPRAEPLRSAP